MSQAPNVVTLLVEAGRNLRPPGSKGVCDPLVVVRCGGKSKQCKALKRTNNPKWHFQAEIGNVDPNELVLIEVRFVFLEFRRGRMDTNDNCFF